MRFFLLLLLFTFLSCENETQEENNNKEVTVGDTNITDGAYSYKITENDTSGFGYEILHGEKLYIRQPVIPAIQGNHAFRSSEDAGKAAKLVLSKLEKGINPPTVSREELEELGVIPE